jgi:hypothetical protein
MPNAAKIKISTDWLLARLQFEGGEILHIGFPQDIYLPKEIEIVIRHPDLPAVEPGSMLETICPCYNIDYDDLYITRTYPPKKALF